MDKNDRILFITGYFPFAQGGAELQAYYLAQKCLDFAKVAFVYRDHSGKRIRADKDFMLFPIKPVNIPLLRRTFFFEGFQLWRNIFKKFSPTVIYCRGMNSYFSFAGQYAKTHDCKLIYHIASDGEFLSVNLKKPWLKLQSLFIQHGFKHANAIIAQTKYQAKLLYENYQRKAAIIPNGHHIPPCHFNKPSEYINILWVANWKPIKQPEIFVKLAKEITRRNNNVRFVMLGRNEGYQTLIDEAVKSGIRVMGEVPNETVNEFFTQSHILVNTSIKEGFSNTFIQAWLRKVPVVSLQVDPDGVLQREGLGVCSGGFKQLVKDIEKLVESKVLLEKMGEKARKYAEQNHSLKNFDKIIHLFK